MRLFSDDTREHRTGIDNAMTGPVPPTAATVPDDGGPYAGRPMTGTFLIDMRGDGHLMPLSTGIKADGPADLATKAREYADRHGFTITGATYAGHPVPGFACAADQQPPNDGVQIADPIITNRRDDADEF